MKRWQAIPVAALATIAVGIALSGTLGVQRQASASAPPVDNDFSVSLDCDPATGIIEASCPAGTGDLDIGVVLQNNSSMPETLNAFNFEVVNNDTSLFVAGPGVDLNKDANPDFNQAALTDPAWSCTLPTPTPDNEFPDNPATQHSFLSCISGLDPIGPGASLLVATVHYNRPAAGNGVFDLANVSFADPAGLTLITCNPTIDVTGPCNSTIIGAAVPTATPTSTATNTPLPTATSTPCQGASCPTPTSLAFVTVTPTGTPATPTAAGGTPAPVATGPVGQAPPPGGPPGGGAGGGTGRPTGTIRLPDTGTGGGGSTNRGLLALIALAAAAAGGAAGAGYLRLAVASARRQRRGED